MFGKEEREVQKLTQAICPNCLTLQRKIEELEQILSGREDILSALQTQLKKYEGNYKNLFEGYEQLRLEHSSALQDNFSLKQINEKLQEIIDAENLRKGILEGEASSSNPENANCQIEVLQSPSVLVILKKVTSIEHLVKSQNEILRDLIQSVLKQRSCCKLEEIIDVPLRAEEDFKQIESGDHLNTHPKYQELLVEIEHLKYLVDQHQTENERMKQALREKKLLTKCTNIGAHICGDPNSDRQVNSDIDRKKLKQLEEEMAEKEKQFERCTCQLVEQLKDMNDNSQMLSDTLAIVMEENKSNLDIINKLKDELKRANQDCEEKTENMQARILELENQLEVNQVTEQKLKESIDLSENETKELQERLTCLMVESSKIKDCKCDTENEFKTKLMGANIENEELRKDLAEKTLEMAEYEEENRNLCQRIELLNKYNNELINKIRELDDELLNREEEVDKAEVSTQISSTDVQNLEEQVTTLQDDKRCLAEKCDAQRREMQDKLFQLENLKNSITIQFDELEKANSENDELKKEIERLKSENVEETERLKHLLNRSQQQVEELLKEQNTKTIQFESVSNELRNIRRSITEENDIFANQIKQFEQEKEELKNKLKEHEQIRDGMCNNAKQEIERLKVELVKKQCIILELEKSIDTFNETISNFDRTADELANENATLKEDKTKSEKEVELLQKNISEMKKELDNALTALDQTDVRCAKACKQIRTLEQENEQLKNRYQLSVQNLKKAEMEKDMLCKDLERVRVDNGQMEKTYAENYQLQLELDQIKENNSRRESITSGKLIDLQNAYDELRNLFDQIQAENEKLRNDAMKCGKALEEAKKACGRLSSENKTLLEAKNMMSQEINGLKTECNKLKNHCTQKTVEVESLRGSISDKSKEKRLYEKECQELAQKNALTQRELLQLREKLAEVSRSDEQKFEELRKIKKQYELCAKQCQISREEYSNLRKEYKEIKALLSDQIKRYRQDIDGLELNQPCEIVRDLKRQLLEKENQMITLQQNLKDASYEIIELKDYIHKLICDNNVLKSGINNLIGNLERKIKGPSFGSLHVNSAEVIADEILQSLTDIEDKIINNATKDICLKGCQGMVCDCMSKITSQYNFKGSKSQYASKIEAESLIIKTSSTMEPTKIDSEINSTDDSDDPQSLGPLNKKDPIDNLKKSIDRTLKEKSCDCEEFLAATFKPK